MRLLFWNLRRKPLHEQLAALVNQYGPDVVVLAECEISHVILLRHLNTGRGPNFRIASGVPGPIVFLVRYPRRFLRPLLDDYPRISMHHISPPIGVDLLVVGVHLPSKLHKEDVDFVYLCQRVREQIEQVEEDLGHQRTVVVGDFNMNPFESGLVAASGLHSVMDLTIASKGSRIVGGQERSYFYNPMWGGFGNRSPGPSGTYYYSKGREVEYFWHTFDQVLLRPALLEYFVDKSLEVVTNAEEMSLLGATGRPDANGASDHLPLTFELRVEGKV